MTQESFGQRLRSVQRQWGPLCVGIDPHRALVESWGLSYDLDGLRRFSAACVEAFGGHVGLVKPQSAFFEVFGSAGVAVLEETVTALRERGTLVILDAKRGDIGTTMDAYAEAFLGKDAVGAPDALTVSPFLGYGALRPAIGLAETTGRAVFVLALTSNPEGPQVQHAVRAGQSVAGAIVAGARADNAPARERGDLGHVGLVIGATVGDAVQRLDLELSTFGGPILAPGFGAQGGTLEDLHRVFAGACADVIPTSSREVLGAGPDAVALRASAEAKNATLATLLNS